MIGKNKIVVAYSRSKSVYMCRSQDRGRAAIVKIENLCPLSLSRLLSDG